MSRASVGIRGVSVGIEIGNTLEATVACDRMTRFANDRAVFEPEKEST